MEPDLNERMGSAAFAFRGYNVTNLGRTPELLEHPAYGPIVERHLKSVSEIFTLATKQPVDLVSRVQQREPTTLERYGEAVCLIAAAELAQIEILKQFFGIEITQAKLLTGYSLGEVSALVAAEVYELESLLIPILTLANDCVELARTVEMGIVFSRGPEIDLRAMEKLCVQVTAQNQGTVAISSYLSPNSMLVLGQNHSLDLFKEEIKSEFPKQVHVRKNPDRWPPIHTPIVRQRNIPDRAAVMLETAPGGLREPTVPIVSCVTGVESYNDFNSRQILYDWIDHPQRLWNVIERFLNSDIHTVIHVGPEPNIFPATFNRLSIDVASQLSQSSLSGIGLRAVSSIVRRRPWLAQYLSKNAALLRAPLIEHIVLEDWLLSTDIPD
jgi:[acyl-carrier-protein] S-malonyltransferase